MSASSSALEKAASAYPDLREYLPGGASLPDVRTLEQFMEQLGLAETAAVNAYRKLVRMAEIRLDKQSDYIIYGQLTNAVYKAQLSAIGLVAAIVRSAGGVAAEALFLGTVTFPTPLPMLTWASRHASQPAGVNGLGWLPLAAGVLAVLGAMGLMYLYSEEIANILDDLTTVYVARARAAQQTELLEARRVAFESCMAAGGGDRPACVAESVALNPEGVDPGAPSGGGNGNSNMLGYLAIGGVVLAGLVGGLYFVFRSSSGRSFRGYSGISAQRINRLPARAPDVDGSKSRYNLEVRR